nr:hypothetical protein [Tanacetum cinerariifolium]
MSTQQDIYIDGSENRPHMLNKDNYVPWSSNLLHYVKSKPNGKLLVNFIIHGPYVRRMIVEPNDPDRDTPVVEYFHEQIHDELTEKEAKRIEANDQAIQIILMGLLEDIYVAVDSYHTAHKTWLCVQQMMKGFNIGEHEKKRISSNPRTRQITQPSMNMGQERHIQMVGGNGGNQFRQYARQNAGNQIGHNAGQITVYQNGYNVVQNARNQGNQIRCYNCIGVGHYARNYTVRPRRRDVAYLQTQVLNAQKEEARIQLHVEEFYLMAAATETEEIRNEPHLVHKDDSNGIPANSSMAHNRRELEQHPTTVEETLSKLILIPDDEFLDNTSSPSVARKFLDEVKDTIVTVQRVVKSRMSLNVNNWSYTVHQEQFLKEAAKFVRDFKSLANEADEPLDMNKVLEHENEHLLRAIENKYALLWNDWYKKCEDCKYVKISYDKAYNDMKLKIEQFQAQLGDIKGQSMNTQCASDTLDPLSQKHDDVNVSLKFQKDKSKVVCASCKKCLITANHDIYVFNYMNGINSRDDNQRANVSNVENQKKHNVKLKKLKKLGSKERIASPRSKIPRTCLVELQANGFQTLLLFLACYRSLFMVGRLGLLQAYDQESKVAHQLRVEVYGNCSLWE